MRIALVLMLLGVLPACGSLEDDVKRCRDSGGTPVVQPAGFSSVSTTVTCVPPQK